MLEWWQTTLWFLLKIIVLCLCQLAELLQTYLQPNDDINTIQFRQKDTKLLQFSYKKSYGSSLWNLFSSHSYFMNYNISRENRNRKIIVLPISNDVQNLSHDVNKGYLRKNNENNIFWNWYCDLNIDTLLFHPITTEVEGAAEVDLTARSRSTSTNSEPNLNLDFLSFDQNDLMQSPSRSPSRSPSPTHFRSPSPVPSPHLRSVILIPGTTPLEKRLFQSFHLQTLEHCAGVTSDFAESLIRISNYSNKEFRHRESIESVDWMIPSHFYAPVMKIVGRDLLVTFPDFRTIFDLVFSDIAGHSLASPASSNYKGVHFHQGFLRHLNQSQDLNYLTFMKSMIDKHFHEGKHTVSRVIITGTGKGAAVASIFTLRHALTILSWPISADTTHFDMTFDDPRDIDENQNLMDLRCITFGCPKFIHCADIGLVDPHISSRIVHIFGEHEFVPLSLTSLTDKFERVGLVVNIKDSKSHSAISRTVSRRGYL